MQWYTSATILAALAVATTVMVWCFLRYRTDRKGYPLPPGPIPLPLIGSALSINPQLPWLTFTEWRKTYGDLVYVRLLDTDVVVLNSSFIATELLEKRSRIYSDRPFIVTVAPYGLDCNFAVFPYGEHWRLCRRILHNTYRADAALAFRPTQLRRARQLICNMIDKPDKYPSHFQTFSAAVGMSAVYDHELAQKDPVVSTLENYFHTTLLGMEPQKILLLRFFPILLRVPDWLPGSWINREAKEACGWKDKLVEMANKYIKQRMDTKEHMNSGIVPENIIRMENMSGSHRSEYETALKDAAVSALIGSAETVNSALMTFTLAMVENPHVWRRAQVEIDAVVGTEKLPEFDDRPSLPYVDAIIRETLRWRPVAPLIAPHAVTCSDVYEGYYIPKGTNIFVNAWAISRDEARYPDAEKFKPERFLSAQGRLTDDDPGKFIFGFGRRSCPGRHAADASLWSVIATMLATLDFNLAKDADGNDITFKVTFTNRATDHPNPFPCRLTPRAHVSKDTFGNIFTD